MSKYLNVRIDVSCAEAELAPTDLFVEEPPLWKLDVLRDVIADAQILYEQTYYEWGEEIETMRGTSNIEIFKR